MAPRELVLLGRQIDAQVQVRARASLQMRFRANVWAGSSPHQTDNKRSKNVSPITVFPQLVRIRAGQASPRTKVR